MGEEEIAPARRPSRGLVQGLRRQDYRYGDPVRSFSDRRFEAHRPTDHVADPLLRRRPSTSTATCSTVIWPVTSRKASVPSPPSYCSNRLPRGALRGGARGRPVRRPGEAAATSGSSRSTWFQQARAPEQRKLTSMPDFVIPAVLQRQLVRVGAGSCAGLFAWWADAFRWPGVGAGGVGGGVGGGARPDRSRLVMSPAFSGHGVCGYSGGVVPV